MGEWTDQEMEDQLRKISTLEEPVWHLDQYKVWDIRVIHDDVVLFAWISPRPHYCDRGHWQLNVEMPWYNIDPQDGFPRYFMDLERAKAEAVEFMIWRVSRGKQAMP